MKRNILVVIATSLLITSCGNNNLSSTDNNSNSESIENNSNTNEKLVYNDFLKASPIKKELVENELGNDFNDNIYHVTDTLSKSLFSSSSKNDNVVFSPLSIYMTLSLLEQCLGDKDIEKIEKYLGFTNEENSNYFNKLCQTLNYNKDSFTRAFTNSIWLSNNFNYQDSMLSKLTDDYYCYPFSVNFGDSRTNDLVHDFIFDMTYKYIDYTPKYDSSTLASFINTLYLNDSWASMLSYSKESYDFKNSDGTTLKTRLLNSSYINGKIYQNDLYSEFEARTCYDQKVKFILPNEGHEVEELFTNNTIYEACNVSYVLNDDNGKYKSRVSFPSFEASYNKSINEIFANDDLSSLFYSANLEKLLVEKEPTKIENITHVSNIKITRDGITAAAVTHIDPSLSESNYSSYVLNSLVLDRPFAFIITTETDIPLFVGAVNKL